MCVDAANIGGDQDFGSEFGVAGAHSHLQEDVRDGAVQRVGHDADFIFWRNVKML